MTMVEALPHFVLRDRPADQELFNPVALIDGDRLSAAGHQDSYSVVNPATGTRLATLPNCGLAEVRRAVEAAHAVQRRWAACSGKERAYVLRRLKYICVEVERA